MDSSSLNLDDHKTNGSENETLINILSFAEARLDEAGKTSATRAFNLGCLIGILPVLFITAIAILLTKSWLAGVITAVLMLIALLGFANLVALISRSNATKRVYVEDVAQQISHKLTEAEISKENFWIFANQNLPESALLREFIPELSQADAPPQRLLKLPKLPIVRKRR